ncbi:insulinase family protein, partial [Patescibacteria group bacterium]|nr:insulinase family protein [Patescibacteria group bacterium]
MKIKNKKLKNGLKVVCAETPYLNKASFAVLVKAGSVYENKNNNGIFHLMEHCIFNGSKKYPSRDDVEKKLNELNIIDRTVTSKEFTKYNFSFHSKDSLKVLNFLLEILTKPVFDNESINEEKQIILEEMETDKNDNYKIFYSKVNKIIFDDTPLGFNPVGTKVSLNKLSRDSVIENHTKYYVCNNMVVSYTGSFESDKIFEKLEKYFSENKNNKLI